MTEAKREKAKKLIAKHTPAEASALGLISATVQRSRALFEPHVLKETSSGEFISDLKSYRIAALSYPIVIKSRRGNIPKVIDNADSLPLIEHRTEHFDITIADHRPDAGIPKINNWCKRISEDCERIIRNNLALNDGIDIKFILLPELSYPSFWPGSCESKDRDQIIINLKAQRDSLNRELQRISTTNNVVIIAGSHHNWITYHNICHIFLLNNTAHEHRKFTSAYKVGEHIKVADSADYPVYNIGSCTFCVLVCTDAFDLNMFFRQILEMDSSNIKAIPKIIFVPSFYETQPYKRHDILEACEQLSRATGTVVVFSNQREDNERSAVFLAGEKIKMKSIVDFGRGTTCSIAEIRPDEFLRCLNETKGVREALSAIFSKTIA